MHVAYFSHLASPIELVHNLKRQWQHRCYLNWHIPATLHLSWLPDYWSTHAAHGFYTFFSRHSVQSPIIQFNQGNTWLRNHQGTVLNAHASSSISLKPITMSLALWAICFLRCSKVSPTSTFQFSNGVIEELVCYIISNMPQIWNMHTTYRMVHYYKWK